MLPWITIFGSLVMRFNYWQIASLVTQKSLFTVTHALFFISWLKFQSLFPRDKLIKHHAGSGDGLAPNTWHQSTFLTHILPPGLNELTAQLFYCLILTLWELNCATEEKIAIPLFPLIWNDYHEGHIIEFDFEWWAWIWLWIIMTLNLTLTNELMFSFNHALEKLQSRWSTYAIFPMQNRMN